MLKLEARRRVGLGKGAGRRIRNKAMIPAVMYGHHGEAVNLAVDPRAVKAILGAPAGINTIFSVEVDGGERVGHACIKAWQMHPVRRTLLHCDILRLDETAARKWKVPVELTGESPAQKIGAKCRFVTREVVVLAKPGDVPATVQVDISGVDLSEMVRLEEVEAPENTKLVFTQNAPVFIAGGLSSIMSDEDEEEGEGEGEEGAEDEAAEAEE